MHPLLALETVALVFASVVCMFISHKVTEFDCAGAYFCHYFIALSFLLMRYAYSEVNVSRSQDLCRGGVVVRERKKRIE